MAGYDVVKDADAVRRAIGVALQEAAIDPLMTGRELLRMQGALHGLRGAEAQRARGDAARPRRARSRPATGASAATRAACGGGWTSRSRSCTGPRVLFLDEPTTGLDPTSRTALWREVRALNDEGTTVFLTTQYLEEAEQLADRVGIIAARHAGRRGHAGRAQGAASASRRSTSSSSTPSDAGRAREALAGARARSSRADPDAPARVALPHGAARRAIAAGRSARSTSAGIEVESIEVESPSLDDVFLAVTGSTLEGAAESRSREAPRRDRGAARSPRGARGRRSGGAR